MSVNIPAGNYEGECTVYEFGPDTKKNSSPAVKITMKVADGPYAGQTAQFKNGFGDKAAKYTKRALLALGWQGKDIQTAKDDIAKAKKRVTFQVEVAEWEGRSWSSVRSIGSFGEPLGKPDDAMIKDVNQWLAEVPDEKPAGDDIPF